MRNFDPTLPLMRAESARQIQYRDVGDLKPDRRYRTRFSYNQASCVARSLVRRGPTHPALLIGDKTIVGGLGLFDASRAFRVRRIPTIDYDALGRFELQQWITSLIAIADQDDWPREILMIEFAVLPYLERSRGLDFAGSVPTRSAA